MNPRSPAVFVPRTKRAEPAGGAKPSDLDRKCCFCMSDNTRVQSATKGTASVHFNFITHVQTSDNLPVQSATEWAAAVHTLTHVQTCDSACVQSATERTASVHTLTHVQTCENARVQVQCRVVVLVHYIGDSWHGRHTTVASRLPIRLVKPGGCFMMTRHEIPEWFT